MANGLYLKGKTALLTTVNLLTDTIKMVLVDGQEYTPNLSTDEFLSDVAAGGRIATVTLAGKTVVDGVFDADDPTFTGVTGDEFEFAVLYKDTGVEGTSNLLACWDTATGLPFTPVGNDILVTFAAASPKIFAI